MSKNYQQTSCHSHHLGITRKLNTVYIFYITGHALYVTLSANNLLKFSYVTDRLIARAS